LDEEGVTKTSKSVVTVAGGHVIGKRAAVGNKLEAIAPTAGGGVSGEGAAYVAEEQTGGEKGSELF